MKAKDNTIKEFRNMLFKFQIIVNRNITQTQHIKLKSPTFSVTKLLMNAVCYKCCDWTVTVFQ